MYDLVVQGDVLQIKKSPSLTERAGIKGNSKRDKITSFSRKSRKRLIEVFNRIDLKRSKLIFMTLSFHSIPQHDFAYNCFRKLIERLRRRFGDIKAIWRKELQERGSIHFHVMFFGLPFVKQAELQEMWTECTGEDLSILDIRLMRGKKHALRYVSKYIAKVGVSESSCSLETVPYPHEGEKQSTGRWWGYINRKILPFAIRRAKRVDNIACLFYLKFTMRQLSYGGCSRKTLSGMLFHDEANMLFDRFLEIEETVSVEVPQRLRLILQS